jgi:hypothetical protein
MTGIPYGPAGLTFQLLSDHEADDYSDTYLLSSPLHADSSLWQRGRPTTDLPVAPVCRARSAGDAR